MPTANVARMVRVYVGRFAWKRAHKARTRGSISLLPPEICKLQDYTFSPNRGYQHDSGVVVQFACHPEQAFVAQRGTWARRFVPVHERHASLDAKLHHYPTLLGPPKQILAIGSAIIRFFASKSLSLMLLGVPGL